MPIPSVQPILVGLLNKKKSSGTYCSTKTWGYLFWNLLIYFFFTGSVGLGRILKMSDAARCWYCAKTWPDVLQRSTRCWIGTACSMSFGSWILQTVKMHPQYHMHGRRLACLCCNSVVMKSEHILWLYGLLAFQKISFWKKQYEGIKR
jgi:hypothetical protein